MKTNFIYGLSSQKPAGFVEKAKRAQFTKTRIAFLISSLILLSVDQQASAATTAMAMSAMAGMAEHTAVQDLVPISAANRQVVRNGSWSDPTVWSGGQVPAAGENIFVPQDKSVLVDVATDSSVGKVRVDGVIEFATNKNVKLKLDTMVVTETGQFIVGSEKNRVPKSNKVEIVIANNGPIDRVWDPKNLSRGIIIQGKTRIFGSDKSAFHKLAAAPALGATQITLGSIPTGWAKDDIIVVTATAFRAKIPGEPRHITFDELRKIKAISGNVITLGQVADSNVTDPLVYNHVPTIPNMPVYAANLTRNVVISGEGGESVPASQRGHFMVMHNPDTIIKGAGFYYLGRTDKSKPIDDFKLDAAGSRIKDATGNFIRDANNNPRGRYAVHFHHTGVGSINTPPVICTGNAVFASAGWGFVNHTSNVNMENNASYDVYGSHFVSEDGNEMGTFKNNIAVKSAGRPTYLKNGQNNHDMGHTGHGLWLESRNLAVENNVVSGVNMAAIVYWHRNNIPGVVLNIPKENLMTPNKEIVKNRTAIYYDRVPITHEKNNTVLASGAALDVIKAFAPENHDVRNMIESLKGYSVVSGINIDYSEKYTLRDVEIVADAKKTRAWSHGLLIAKKAADIVMQNSTINGFVHPIITGIIPATGATDPTMESTFVDVKINGRAINPLTDIHKPYVATVSNYSPAVNHIINFLGSDADKLTQANQSVLSFTANSDQSPNFPTSFNLEYKVVGVKKDSLGETRFHSNWNGLELRDTFKKGYYTDTAGNKYILLTDLVADRLTGEVKKVSTKLKIVSRYLGYGPNLGTLPQ